MLLIAASGILALAGCATSSTDQQLRELAAASTLPATQPTTTAPSGEVELPPGAGPNEYVRLALERNPRITAAVNQVRRQRAVADQAGSLPDPMVGVMVGGMTDKGVTDPSETMLTAEQMLLLPRKLSARVDAASREGDAVAAEFETLRQTVAAETRQAYWTYWLADREIEVTRQSRNLLEDVLRTAEAQLAAGGATQADVLRATTTLATLDNELLDLERNQQVAAARLNRLLDRSDDQPLPALPDSTPLSKSTAQANGTDRINPRLIAARERIAAAQARLRSARLDYWPDVTLMAGYTFIDDESMSAMGYGEDQWSVGFEINVPLWLGRRRAGEREARAEVAQEVAQLARTQNDLTFEVEQARAEVENARRLVTLLQESVLPLSQQTLEATAAAYRADHTDFLSYIDAWQQLLDYQLAERRAIADLGRSHAALDLALGRDPLEVSR